MSEQNEKALSETDFDSLMRILVSYAFADLEEDGIFEDKTDVERELVEKVAIRSIQTSCEVLEYIAQLDLDKIRKVDTLNMNDDYELAHKLLFEG